MRVLIVTDAFPPGCGGSGWSTFHLARALAARGHALRVVKPEANLAGVGRRELDGIPVADFGYALHDVPYVRSFERDLRLGQRLERFLAAELEAWPADVVHAQHTLSAPPAIAAAARLGLPSIVTVRDYWPVCYFTTAHVEGAFCPDCSFAKMLACMKGKSPRAYWAGIPLMPYMRRIVRRKQRALAAADAVIAVSEYVAAHAVREIVGAARTHVIPNPIDAAEVERVAATPPAFELPERFVMFAGKLGRLKGAWLALEACGEIGTRGAVLLMVGDGPDRAALEAAARSRGLPVRFLPWVDNRDVWRIMRRAAAILVPSLWLEPLSRTVTEAMAVGVPVLATDRGGIHDQIRHHESGAVLPAEPAAFAAEIDRLLDAPALGRSWAQHAREAITARFDDAVVVPRIEALYAHAIEGTRGLSERRAGGER
jgi:glycosyltransferase involved in cell wall biosynthesis